MLPGARILMLGCALACALALPLAASAQFTSADPFTVSVSPQFPAPYSSATLSLVSTNMDLTNSTVTVRAGGAQIYQGNAGSIPVALGAAGKPVTVTVAVTSGGATQSQTLSITPQDVSIVAEPIASTPPLYPGKPLVPLEGTTRVIAVANVRTPGGVQISPAALSYAWTVDGTALASASGIGKDAVIVASPLEYRTRSVSVTVQSQDGSYAGGASLALSPSEPTLRLYASDPLLGINFDHALAGTYAITGAETSLYAAPFSFPTNGSAPVVSWFLNGSSVENGPSVTLRPTGSGTGSANVSATASSGSYTQAAASLSLTFGSNSGSGIFGL